MKKLIALVLLVFINLSFAQKADKIVVFGDSLSDNGNIAALTGRLHKAIPMIPIIPKPNIYYEGHFSNGKVWAEVFADALGFSTDDTKQFLDHAYGGAWAESVLRSKLIFPPTLSVQISNFLVENYFDKNKGDHLYTLWIGSNDYLSQRVEDLSMVDKTIDVIHYQLERLVYYGARKFVIPNLPDLGKTPKAKVLGMEKEYTELSWYHNKKLQALVEEIKATYPDVTIVEIDVSKELTKIFSEGEKNHYGFKHFQEPCYSGDYYISENPQYQGVMSEAKKAGLDIEGNASLMAATQLGDDYTICKNPNEYIFWDQVHPTSKVHFLIGMEVALKLQALGLV